jgi:alkylation response protein AidB-like acyl-CoA dehydrogenase
MDWADSAEQARFRAQVRTLIDESLPALYRRRAAEARPRGLGGVWAEDLRSDDPEAREAARAWADALHTGGFSAPAWPREYGGAGLSTMEQFIFNQELALAQAPAVGGGGYSLIGSALIAHGTEEQRQRFLPKTLTGEWQWYQGFSEPGAGSDLASLQCRAVRDGDEYVITGQKLWGRSRNTDWCFGLFRTDPEAPKHRGISFMVVDMHQPGISSRPIITLTGEAEVDETFFEGVRVPADQVIGEEHRGWYVAMYVLDIERSNVGNAVLLRRYLNELLAWLGTHLGRMQGGGGRLRLQRLALAQHYIDSEILFNVSYRIASLQGANLPNTAESSTAKILGSELTQRIAHTATKLYGLSSGIWDPDSEHVPQGGLFTYEYLHSVLLSIYGGSNEIQRNVIATRGLGLPRG